MTALVPILAHDTRLQFRYGIYAAYAVVTAFYVTFFLLAGSLVPTWVPAVIVYTDPAVVGFFFLGALMLLERGENTRMALAATPIGAADYIAGKAITLTGLGLVATFILVPFAHADANLILLGVTVVLTSLAYIGIGVAFARRCRTVNAYLIGSGALLTPLIAPGFLALLPEMPLPIVLIPTAAQLRLTLAALGAVPADPLEVGIGLAIAAMTAIACLAFAIRDLKTEFGK
ncbi:hypothetical protein [Devosia sp.]|uniref:hypothetical protein n=1 Tax=Devosia sp. TaxID=1871048 RepID=UPI003A916557